MRPGPNLFDGLAHASPPAAAPVVSRLERAALLQAIKRTPALAAQLSARQLADRPFLLQMLAMGGSLLQYLPPAKRSDKQLANAAVASDPNAIEFVINPDKALALKAVQADGYSIAYLPKALASDKALALVAMRCSPWCLRYLSAKQRKDREIVREACLRCYDSLRHADPALFNDAALMRELAEAHPLTLELLPPHARAKLQDLESRCNTLRARVDAQRISTPARLGSLQTLEAILHNREHPDEDDSRPVAVCLVGTDDHNGALYHSRFSELTRHYRVVYMEVSTDMELIASLKKATEHKRAALVTIGGHGAQNETAFGAPDPRFTASSEEALMLDFSDLRQLSSENLDDCIEPHAHIVLESCSTGEGRSEARNIANLLARVFHSGHLHAPTMPTNNWLQLDAQGRFVGPGYLAGEAFTYDVPPR